MIMPFPHLTRAACLTGWQRLAIIFAVVWIVGIGLTARMYFVKRASDALSFTFRICTNDYHDSENDKACTAQADKAWYMALEWSWAATAFLAFVPLPLFWLFGYWSRCVYRWVRRGFDRPAIISRS